MKFSGYVLFLSIIILSSCSTARNCDTAISENENLMLYLSEDDSVWRIALIAEGFSSLSDVKAKEKIEIGLTVSGQSKKIIFESGDVEFPKVGSAVSAIYHSAVFEINKNLFPTGLIEKIFKFSIRKDDNCYYLVKDYEELLTESKKLGEPTALKLFPYHANLDNGAVEFGLLALRLSEKEGEYLPSSEHLRVKIKTRSGKTIWNSDKGKNFLTVILEVIPPKVGETGKYFINWNGKTRSGKPLKSGVYIVEMTIPAYPENYNVTMKYERIYNDK